MGPLEFDVEKTAAAMALWICWPMTVVLRISWSYDGQYQYKKEPMPWVGRKTVKPGHYFACFFHLGILLATKKMLQPLEAE